MAAEREEANYETTGVNAQTFLIERLWSLEGLIYEGSLDFDLTSGVSCFVNRDKLCTGK